jgi:diguanylate cyclase (GGDEF)-like protein
MQFIEFLQRQSLSCIIGAGVLLVLALWGLDYFAAPDVTFVVFYIIPVFLVTWFAGKGGGMAIAVLSGLAWFTADVLTTPSYSHPSVPYLNLITKLGFFLIVSATVSLLRTSLDREREMARTDYVTTVANSRYFAEIASQEIRRAGRYQHPFTVAYLDIDDFKQVNDRWGHSTGDELLALVASTIRDNIRVTDTVARMGGDEFALLLPETGFEASDIVIRKVRESLLAVMRQQGWPVSFSVGVVTFAAPPESVDVMIKTADGFMYEVKHEGKNSIKHRQIENRAA